MVEDGVGWRLVDVVDGSIPLSSEVFSKFKPKTERIVTKVNSALCVRKAHRKALQQTKEQASSIQSPTMLHRSCCISPPFFPIYQTKSWISTPIALYDVRR